MLRALEKRPVGSDDIEAAINRIKQELRALGEREISAQELGEKVMKELSLLDHVAFVRFASVYRSFQDVSEFTEMIEHLQTTATDGGSVATGREPVRPTATDGGRDCSRQSSALPPSMEVGSVATGIEPVRQK